MSSSHESHSHPSGGHDSHDHASHGQEARTVERHCDVCVIGGSAAGIAAALDLGQHRRSVIVVEAGFHSGSGEDLPSAEQAAAGREEVRSHGVEIITGPTSEVSRGEAGDFRVALASGHAIVARRVLVATGLAGAEQFAALGLRPQDFLETGVTGETTVPGCYAVGDATDPSQQAPQADVRGRQVGHAISVSLDSEDAEAAARPSGNQADWEHRYSGERMWSGNPNGSLVNEASGLKPGRALDVGAGEGADAIWLAEQGWSVTANDVAQLPLDRLSAEAGRRGLRVETCRADANVPDPFGTAPFDLVSAAYASIPRTPDDRAVRSILSAVAPGGTLLIVSHDLEPMRAPGHDRIFDPDAYVRVEDFAAALAGAPDWDVELHEKRDRPAGSATAHHHVHDIVFRARRRAAD